ncbi:putative phage tail protein [Paenibacillus sp.]|uniref:putative phage tail protein n=1 Tax=Paenibacillus sp. TaxID=58172 RepID=UPI0028114C68|nr:putative phage tail protein [Paenibacillus sp.]
MPYGDSQYGVNGFGEDSDTGDGGEEFQVDLMGYLPPFYRDYREMVGLQTTLGKDIGLLKRMSTDLLDEVFVGTSAEALHLWERDLGLQTDSSKPAPWRREVILSKLRGSGTTTKKNVIAAAATFSGGKVDVIEYPDEYRFVVQFIGTLGIPPNMAGFIQMIEQIKPAHLAYELLFTYTAWNMVEEETWASLGATSWNALRTYGG